MDYPDVFPAEKQPVVELPDLSLGRMVGAVLAGWVAAVIAFLALVWIFLGLSFSQAWNQIIVLIGLSAGMHAGQAWALHGYVKNDWLWVALSTTAGGLGAAGLWALTRFIAQEDPQSILYGNSWITVMLVLGGYGLITGLVQAALLRDRRVDWWAVSILEWMAIGGLLSRLWR